MGIIISRFRKKQTTAQVLDSLEKKIKGIEEFQRITEQQQKVVVGRLFFYSVTLYFGAAVIFYFFFTPASIRENIMYLIPLLIYPVIIFLTRKVISWYYRRQTEKNEGKLFELKAEKKKVLDEVMDKETYKAAKEILEKYAPEQLLMKGVVANGNKITKTSIQSPVVALPSSNNELVLRKTKTPASDLNRSSSFECSYGPVLTATDSQLSQPKFPFVRPILPQSRGPFDKLVEMVIGDGPNNRYALICKTCSSHNGMALKQEFDYLAFRCAYCLQYNPARKCRPHSPNKRLSDSEETRGVLDDEEVDSSPAKSDSETMLSITDKEVDSSPAKSDNERMLNITGVSAVSDEGEENDAGFEEEEDTESETVHLEEGDSTDGLCNAVNKVNLDDTDAIVAAVKDINTESSQLGDLEYNQTEKNVQQETDSKSIN